MTTSLPLTQARSAKLIEVWIILLILKYYFYNDWATPYSRSAATRPRRQTASTQTKLPKLTALQQQKSGITSPAIFFFVPESDFEILLLTILQQAHEQIEVGFNAVLQITIFQSCLVVYWSEVRFTEIPIHQIKNWGMGCPIYWVIIHWIWQVIIIPRNCRGILLSGDEVCK